MWKIARFEYENRAVVVMQNLNYIFIQNSIRNLRFLSTKKNIKLIKRAMGL